jgi:nucleotide-binding universal stress UspA family protein
MTKKVLIGYDGSACADAALEDLARAGLAAELDALVISVADVWLPPDPNKFEPVFPERLPRAAQQARAQAVQAVEASRALADQAAERLKALFPSWKVGAWACGDSPGWAVVKKADEWKADLVVVGSHGRSALERLFLGSVSQKVVAEAHCSVRIARPRRQPRHARLRILVAVDGSPDSSTAVRAVASRTWPALTEFRVAAVIDPRLETAVAWPGAYADQWLAEEDMNVSEWVSRVVNHFAGKLRDAGLQVETSVSAGDPKPLLLKAAEDWEADCIFLGARGLQHGERLFLGTTASAIATRAHCSVEIVRPT